MNWKKKLSSRKLWASVASFVALLVVALGGTQNQAAQITAIIMAGATIVAYIVGEGFVDAASAGATAANGGSDSLTPTGEVVSADMPAIVSAGADQAAQVKQVTAAMESNESGAVASDTTGAK